MTYVVDASVAVKWFVQENLRDQAMLLLDHPERLQAPDLIVPETANIAWKKCLRGEIGREQATLVATGIAGFIPFLHASVSLIESALDLALRLNHPVYDCLYLACADAADGVLVTADGRLWKAVQDTRFATSVQYLESMKSEYEVGQTLLPLKIHFSKIEEIIEITDRVGQTNQFVEDAYSQEDATTSRFFTPEEIRMRLRSPNMLRLKRLFDELPRHDRVDLLALGWLGQGDSGTDLEDLLRRAETSIDGLEDNIYLISLTVYLRKGLELLRELAGQGADR